MARRYIDTELRADTDGDTLRLSGYAAVFDSPAHGEVVTRTAFKRTLDHGADVRLLLNHDGLPLARTKSGTLDLSTDDRGLMVKADLDPDSQLARDVLSAVKRGDMTGMSFGFRVVQDGYTADGVRELREVALHDVSVVTYPWYEDTTVVARSVEDLNDRTADRLEQMLAEYRSKPSGPDGPEQSTPAGKASDVTSTPASTEDDSISRARLRAQKLIKSLSKED